MWMRWALRLGVRREAAEGGRAPILGHLSPLIRLAAILTLVCAGLLAGPAAVRAAVVTRLPADAYQLRPAAGGGTAFAISKRERHEVRVLRDGRATTIATLPRHGRDESLRFSLSASHVAVVRTSIGGYRRDALFAGQPGGPLTGLASCRQRFADFGMAFALDGETLVYDASCTTSDRGRQLTVLNLATAERRTLRPASFDTELPPVQSGRYLAFRELRGPAGEAVVVHDVLADRLAYRVAAPRTSAFAIQPDGTLAVVRHRNATLCGSVVLWYSVVEPSAHTVARDACANFVAIAGDRILYLGNGQQAASATLIMRDLIGAQSPLTDLLGYGEVDEVAIDPSVFFTPDGASASAYIGDCDSRTTSVYEIPLAPADPLPLEGFDCRPRLLPNQIRLRRTRRGRALAVPLDCPHGCTIFRAWVRVGRAAAHAPQRYGGYAALRMPAQGHGTLSFPLSPRLARRLAHKERIRIVLNLHFNNHTADGEYTTRTLTARAR